MPSPGGTPYIRKPKPPKNPEEAMRSCLRCGKMFLSTSKAHRRCSMCQKIINKEGIVDPVMCYGTYRYHKHGRDI